MDFFAWVIVAAIVIATVARRSGGVKRGVDALQRQIAAAQAAAQEAAAARGVTVLPPGIPLRRAVAPARAAGPPRPAGPRPVSAPPAPATMAPAAQAKAATPRTGGPLRASLAEAFGDPGHARTAIILAEILGPPKALR